LNELRLLNPSYKKQIINGSAASPKRLVIPSVGKQLYASLYDVLNSTEVLSGAQMTAVSNTGSNKNKAGLPESHQVHEGQTLLMVANQYGVEVQDLKVYNNLQNTQIVPGQSIRLKPERINAKANPPRYIIYMVRAGDTLSEIAAKFSGATTLKIKALNGLKKNTLHPGMKLKINKG
jgi:membrane-bound lytic murein transglycosylase D